MNQGDENQQPAGATSESPRPALLPCPFCSRAPVLKRVPFSREVLAQVPDPDSYWWVGCEIDANITGCGIGHSNIDKAEVIRKWNTRPSAWQAIETVPKDGTRVLLSFEKIDVYIGFRFAPPSGSDRWLMDSGDEFYNQPTAWMPLPPAPEQKTEETK